MPPKSKVKFTEKERQNMKEKDILATTTPPGSDKETPNNKAGGKEEKRKSSKKLKPGLAEMLTSDEMDENSYDDNRSVRNSKWVEQEETSAYLETSTNSTGKLRSNLTLSDADKNVSDGSTSELEVPVVKWPDAAALAATPVCQQKNAAAVEAGGGGGGGGGEAVGQLEGKTCGFGVKVTPSMTVSPCIKSDNQKFATTDYATSAAIHFNFVPKLIHPLNGQVSTFINHREFTDYLRNAGCLRLFGTCILSVYRMKSWPDPENLMEQILNSMGYQVPSRKQVADLTSRKQSLALKLKLLTKERCQLLERLDEYEDSAAKYELLDQDEILPPRPDNSVLNMERISETFKNLLFDAPSEAGRGKETADLKVIVSKPAPVKDTLPIPYHDKRMLQ